MINKGASPHVCQSNWFPSTRDSTGSSQTDPPSGGHSAPSTPRGGGRGREREREGVSETQRERERE